MYAQGVCMSMNIVSFYLSQFSRPYQTSKLVLEHLC